MNPCKHCRQPRDHHGYYVADLWNQWFCCPRRFWDAQASAEYEPGAMREWSEWEEIVEERRRARHE